jgi:hypothetical protein
MSERTEPQWSRVDSRPLQIPLTNLNSVTVPGAAAGWLKTVEEFGSGKLSMEEILAPAIRMAREGIPEHELNANQVSRDEPAWGTASLQHRNLLWLSSERLWPDGSWVAWCAVEDLGEAAQERFAKLERVSRLRLYPYPNG